jgi:hypothetical protein
MERLGHKIDNIHKMIVALESSIHELEEFSGTRHEEFIQDSVISRFKILIESSWKCLKLYLEQQELSDVACFS